MPVVLHQFAISHFCEKIRWALDLKGVEHRLQGHVPGLHARAARRLTGKSSLPVLELEDGEALRDSATILDRLDTLYPEPPLTPSEPASGAEAREWEQRLDERMGVALRRVCYGTLLDHRDVCLPLLTSGTPWYGRFVMPVMWPKLVPVMREGFGLTTAQVAAAETDIETMLGELAAARGDGDYLVGDRFTRADLTAAAMFAPLAREPGYGMPWPARFPDPLGAFAERMSPRLSWVGEIYAKHRERSTLSP